MLPEQALGGAEFLTRFSLAALAVWRIGHLLSQEDGPGDVLANFRIKLGNGFLGKLMDCFYCLSVWVALAFTPAVTWKPMDALLVWIALSGAACLLERATAPSVSIQQLPEQPDL